jgi:hypothetical protein
MLTAASLLDFFGLYLADVALKLADVYFGFQTASVKPIDHFGAGSGILSNGVDVHGVAIHQAVHDAVIPNEVQPGSPVG